MAASPYICAGILIIHAKVAESLKKLAEKAGPKAPLCIVAHSLGTVIASNYSHDSAGHCEWVLQSVIRSPAFLQPLAFSLLFLRLTVH